MLGLVVIRRVEMGNAVTWLRCLLICTCQTLHRGVCPWTHKPHIQSSQDNIELFKSSYSRQTRLHHIYARSQPGISSIFSAYPVRKTEARENKSWSSSENTLCWRIARLFASTGLQHTSGYLRTHVISGIRTRDQRDLLLQLFESNSLRALASVRVVCGVCAAKYLFSVG